MNNLIANPIYHNCKGKGWTDQGSSGETSQYRERMDRLLKVIEFHLSQSKIPRGANE